MSEQNIRIDKWLWAVRIFKTRSQSAEACKSGKVKVNDQSVKASREVLIDCVITVKLKHITKTIRVLNLLNNRVGAKLVPEYMEDLTPDEEYQKLKIKNEMNYEFWQGGYGRPTKKARRQIDKLKKIRNKL